MAGTSDVLLITPGAVLPLFGQETLSADLSKQMLAACSTLEDVSAACEILPEQFEAVLRNLGGPNDFGDVALMTQEEIMEALAPFDPTAVLKARFRRWWRGVRAKVGISAGRPGPSALQPALRVPPPL